jgi:pyrroline-5-carboxylate reductase
VSTTASLKDVTGTIVLVGAGKMGAALLDGWIAGGLDPAKVVVIEPQPSPAITRHAARGLKINPESGAASAEVVVLAIKPQAAADVMPSLHRFISSSSVAVSIMAGKTLKFLQAGLPDGTAVVRAMPNTPAAIGRGITVAVPNAKVTAAQRHAADLLLAAAGAVEWIADETLMDAVTAVSGSGPAYVFLLAEELAKAGVAAGLSPALAEKLARVTVAGSGELLHRSNEEAAILRKNVTSPGGTTAAALEVLMASDGLDPLMKKAIIAATKRSKELGS